MHLKTPVVNLQLQINMDSSKTLLITLLDVKIYNIEKNTILRKQINTAYAIIKTLFLGLRSPIKNTFYILVPISHMVYVFSRKTSIKSLAFVLMYFC